MARANYTDVRINFQHAMQAAFGLPLRRLSLPKIEPQGPIREYEGVELIEADETVALSLLGTPLLDVIQVEAGVTPKGRAYEAYDFITDPLIDIQRRKRIVETHLHGGDGSVIEQIGKENWQIKLRGLVWGSDGKYPYDLVDQLQRLCDLDASLSVSSKLLNVFGITNLVITDYGFPPIQSFPDTQPYEITAISDKAIEIQITEEEG